MKEQKQNSQKAILFILIATLSFAVMNTVAKYLVDYNAFQIVFFRAAGTFIFMFPYMMYKKISILGTHRKILLLRSIVGFLSLSAFFMAVQRMPLGSAVSIRYVGPLIGVILSWLFLKEKVKPLQWISFFVAIVGVVILKGFDFRIGHVGFLLILFSAITVGAVFTLVRYLATREHHLTIINYFMVISMVLSLTTFHLWKMPANGDWVFLIMMGITGLIGQVFMTKALHLGETNMLAPFKYMELVYSLIFGLVIFGEGYSLISFSGILIIILAMLLNVWAKSRKTQFDTAN